MKNFKKFEAKAVKNAKTVRGGNNIGNGCDHAAYEDGKCNVVSLKR